METDKPKTWGVWRHFYAAAAVVFLSFTFAMAHSAPSVEALPTTPHTMNFHGRLTDTNGDPVADGMYNMTFRLYNALTGGTLEWSEVHEATDRVQVAGGTFSVQLGSVTPLSPSLMVSQSLYLEIELPNPATATCSTAGCANYDQGPMTPRSILGASPYALNAETLDGIDSQSFARTDTANSFTSPNAVKVTAGNAFGVADASNNTLLLADTDDMVVKIGDPSTSTLSNVRLLTTNAEFTGTVRVGDGTNGVDVSSSGVSLHGTAQPTRHITLSPEYPGATFTGDGTNNNGNLTSDFCSPSSQLNINTGACSNSTTSRTYYTWASQGGQADYDIYVRYQLPSDYAAGSMSNFQVSAAAASANTGNSVIVTMYPVGSGTACFTTPNAAGNQQWDTATVSDPLGGCSLSANDMVVFKIDLSDTTGVGVAVGDLSFDYKSKF